MSLIGQDKDEVDGGRPVSDAHDNDERFTRADWRPSKHHALRKRLKPYGGRKSAPKAFLEAAKRTQFGTGVHRICSATKRDGTPCRMIALSDMAVCGQHGGFGQWARQGRLQRSGKSAIAREQKQIAMKEARAQAAPSDLTRMPAFQQANQWDRIRLIKAWQTNAFPRLAKMIKLRSIAVIV